MKIRFYPLISMLMAFAVLSAACGKKGPPLPRPPSFSAAVRDLRAAAEGGSVILKGVVYGKSYDIESVSGCLVQHAWYPPGKKPCEGCPIDYGPFETIHGPVSGPDGFSCRVPSSGEAGVHFFRVSLLGSGGGSGPPSASVSIKIGE